MRTRYILQSFSLRTKARFIAIVVALGFIGIIFISSSINQKRTELRLLNSDNLLWSFSRLEIDFVTLISLTQNSLDDSGQHRTEMFLALSKIESRLFSLYHSFSNADLEQKQTFDVAYGKSLAPWTPFAHRFLQLRRLRKLILAYLRQICLRLSLTWMRLQLLALATR